MGGRLTVDESGSHEDLIPRLLASSHRDRPALRAEVVERLRLGPDPGGCLEALLCGCTQRGGPDGLDIAIDVLAQCGDLAADRAGKLWYEDAGRWAGSSPHPRHHREDDVWYILLRAVGRSEIDRWRKLTVLACCAFDGPVGVREAAVRGLGDADGPHAARLLRRVADADPSRAVREAADEVLADLEDD
jgi:hypothetical protein